MEGRGERHSHLIHALNINLVQVSGPYPGLVQRGSGLRGAREAVGRGEDHPLSELCRGAQSFRGGLQFSI